MSIDKNKIIESAAKLVAKGAFDKAIKEYQKVLDADPKDVRVLHKLGELYQKKNDNVQAAGYFTKVAENYASDGFFLKAVALYKQVLKLNPNLVEVNLRLAELHQQLQLMSEAMAYFQIVANHHDKNGDVKASLDILKKMVELDPDNVASRIKLAELYAREKMEGPALAEFKKAAEYLKRNNRGDDYLRVAERLSTLEPGNIQLAKELATSFIQRSDHKRALAKLQLAFKADPQDIETLGLLVQAFEGLGQSNKAISVYKELAKVHQDRGRPQDADRVWEKIKLLDPTDADVVARRKAMEPERPAPEPARPTAAAAPVPAPQAAPPPPRPAPSSAGLGREQLSKLLTETDVYVKYGLHDKALEHLRKIFTVDPENLDAHEKAYQIYVGSGNTTQAADQLLNVLRLCTRRADVQRAQPYLTAILQENPGHPEVPAFLSVLRIAGEDGVEEEVLDSAASDEAILVDSADDEIIVSDAPDDALANVSPEALARATAPREELGEDGDIFTDEHAVVDDASLVDDAAVAAATEDDEPLLSRHDEPFGLDSGSDEALVPEDDAPAPPPVGDATFTPMGFDDEFEPPTLVNRAPSPEELRRFMLSTPEPPTDPSKTPFGKAAPGKAPPPEAKLNVPPPAAKPSPVAAKPAAPAPPAGKPEAPGPGVAKPAPAPAPVAAKPAPAPAKPPPPPPEAEESDSAAEECDEAQFFLDQGLYEEAREILETLQIAFPGHARAEGLMARLEAEAQSGGAPAEPPPSSTSEEAAPPLVQPVPESTVNLVAELATEFQAAAKEAKAADEDDFQYSVEEVFSEFKKGLEKVVKPEDVETHYDLGIAYKEMMLIDDAIGEFNVALQGCQGKKKEIDCLTMIGMLQGMKGEHQAAVDAYRMALGSDHAVGEAAKALEFELAAAYEAMGSPGKALFHFQKVSKLDPRYRDVSNIAARLAAKTAPEEGPGPLKSPPKAADGKARKVGYV